MARLLIVLFVFLTIGIIFSGSNPWTSTGTSGSDENGKQFRQIEGTIRKGETLFDIFRQCGLDMQELFEMREASASLYRLGDMRPGRGYKILLDGQDRVSHFAYSIDDESSLTIRRSTSGFLADRVSTPYEKRTVYLTGNIRDNLVSAIGEKYNGIQAALSLSDIFAWDIDFTTDIRQGDRYTVIIEGLYRDGVLKRYGEILCAEFVNDGQVYRAYRLDRDGRAAYYDEEGRSLRKHFLKAPLSFRRISSAFSRSRLHPILKIPRPHHGIDYAAPAGTPVSAVADGAVLFSGSKGQYGRVVRLKHRNGYETYYGHLARFGKEIGKGIRVEQGQVIGYVGATGLATGPHLHFEMRQRGRPVDPAGQKILHGEPVPAADLIEFSRLRDDMTARLAAMSSRSAAYREESGGNRRWKGAFPRGGE